MKLGEIIAARIKELGMSKAEFGRRIHTSRQNVNTLLKRDYFDTRMLANISKVLGYNFFDHIPQPFDKTLLKRRKVLLILEIPEGDNLETFLGQQMSILSR